MSKRAAASSQQAPVSTHTGAKAKSFNFISGLPRSGSTLLSAILRQNPRFHAGMTSPVGGLFNNLIASVSAGSELAPMVNADQRKRLAQGLFDSYYAGLPPETSLVFDTNRAWTANLAAVDELYPDAKVICCVRNVAWVVDSMERQFQKDPFENTRLFGDASQRSTVFSRCEALLNRTGMVGYAWSALQEALYGAHADKLLLVDYDLLVSRPREVLNLIYGFIGEETYEHDFENVAYNAQAFDENLGVAGLHKVHKKVGPRPRTSILPPELFQQYSQLNFWQTLKNTKARMITPQPEQPPVSVQVSLDGPKVLATEEPAAAAAALN